MSDRFKVGDWVKISKAWNVDGAVQIAGFPTTTLAREKHYPVQFRNGIVVNIYEWALKRYNKDWGDGE